MTAVQDSVLDRTRRVKQSLAREGDPSSVQAVVDGLCPECGARDVVTVRADIIRFTCGECGADFTV